MHAYFNNWERTLAAMDQLAFGGFDRRRSRGNGTWQNATVEEGEGGFVLRADVPGFGEKDIQIELEQDVLTISGGQQPATQESTSAGEQDPPVYTFQRAYTLPPGIDASKISATVKNGVLQVQLPKSEASKPRKIEVRAS